MRFSYCLRLSTHLLKRNYVFGVGQLNNMSANKRTGDNLNYSGPSKIQRNQVNSSGGNFTKQALSVSTMKANGNDTKQLGHEVEVMETPIKSENDKKSYRVIRLSNGLTALLISDPTQASESDEQVKQDEAAATSGGVQEEESEEEEDDGNDADNESTDNENNDDEGENARKDQKRGKLAACSLCVDVGSFSDPRDIQGLAHFLEHMIFMGSEKYPGENEFDQFMQKAGGFDNADTDFDETSFYFNTREEFLDEALDRFSQFFKAPLMLKEAMTREREAVESEFASKKNGEDVRRGQLLSSIGQLTHPCSIFAWGNLETLKENIDDETLYKKVHEFRKRHYSANRMYVCLQSNKSLDTLQEMVVRHFSDVPNNNMPGDDFSAFTHENAFQSKFYEKVYFVKPIGNISKIDITWCLEPMTVNFKSKPDGYLSHLLGHEGKGSLLSYLRKKLWAVELMSGTDNSGMGDNKLFFLFNICVYLTEDGFDHLDEVLAAVFSYLKLLQKEGPKEWIFREIQTIEANAFRFSNESDALGNVESLVLSLKQYPSKYILSGDTLFFEYDANAIRKIIDDINSRKFNIMITSTRRYNEKVTYESTEPWFGTMYTEMDMPTKWIESWEKAKPLPEFLLPEPNPFISDDFTILYADGDVIPKYPEQIFENELCELWYRQDDKFLLPTACYNFYFTTPLAKSSIDNMILMTLMSTMLKHQFVEKLYPAMMAGLDYTCFASDLGLVFKAAGFNQKLHLIVDVFSKCLKSLADDSTEEQFNMFVQQQFKTYENIFLRPHALAKDLHSNIIQAHYEPLYEKNKRMRSITFADFQQLCRHYCDQVRVKALMQGNIKKDHAMDIMQNVLKDLKFGKVADLSTIELKARRLPIGANYLRCKSFHPKDANSIIGNFYQIGPISYRTEILLHLLVVVAQEPIFDILRNKEQLAYDVSFVSRDNFGMLGYGIGVNSQETKFTAEHVDERIENFRRELLSIIEKMTDDDFNAIKVSMAKNILNEDIKLSDEADKNWGEITASEYEFDRVHKQVEVLTTITKAQLLEFYRTHCDIKNQRKLSIQVIGNAQANDKSDDKPDDTDLMDECGDYETRRSRFDSITYLDFTGEPKGNLIKDLVKFRSGLEVCPAYTTSSQKEFSV